MDLRQLTALLAVAEHGSFSAAARAIHTVQSNVSTHVARLEKELAVTLVDRSSGGLTEEGEVAVGRARRIQAEIDALASDVAALRDEVIGNVRLGMIGSVGRWLVPDLLDTMTDRHPAVGLVVVDATTTSLLPQLLDGSLDMAVVNLPVPDPQLGVEPLFEEERILVAPTGHPLASASTLTLAEIAPHGLVLEPEGTAFRDELDQTAAALGLELVESAEVDGMTLVASLAFRGHGPAILPTTATLLEPAGDWVRIPISDLGDRGVGLARRRAGRLPAPSRAVRAVLRELIERDAPRRDGVRVTGRSSDG
ncbi:MAG: LysR family transcriptional regulator [Acidimicrobiales bacterium]|nr:LysR family transcriptional regulator [Acidimicrobiales bacterium]